MGSWENDWCKLKAPSIVSIKRKFEFQRIFFVNCFFPKTQLTFLCRLNPGIQQHHFNIIHCMYFKNKTILLLSRNSVWKISAALNDLKWYYLYWNTTIGVVKYQLSYLSPAFLLNVADFVPRRILTDFVPNRFRPIFNTFRPIFDRFRPTQISSHFWQISSHFW